MVRVFAGVVAAIALTLLIVSFTGIVSGDSLTTNIKTTDVKNLQDSASEEEVNLTPSSTTPSNQTRVEGSEIEKESDREPMDHVDGVPLEDILEESDTESQRRYTAFSSMERESTPTPGIASNETVYKIGLKSQLVESGKMRVEGDLIGNEEKTQIGSWSEYRDVWGSVHTRETYPESMSNVFLGYRIPQPHPSDLSFYIEVLETPDIGHSEYGRDSIRIADVEAATNIGNEDPLPVENLSENLTESMVIEDSFYKPEVHEGLFLKTSNPETTSVIYDSGEVYHTGANTPGDVDKGLKIIFGELRDHGIEVTDDPDVLVTNIVGSAVFDVGSQDYVTDLPPENLVTAGNQSEWLIYYSDDPEMSAILTTTGYFVGLGGQRPEDLDTLVKDIDQEISNSRDTQFAWNMSTPESQNSDGKIPVQLEVTNTGNEAGLVSGSINISAKSSIGTELSYTEELGFFEVQPGETRSREAYVEHMSADTVHSLSLYSLGSHVETDTVDINVSKEYDLAGSADRDGYNVIARTELEEGVSDVEVGETIALGFPRDADLPTGADYPDEDEFTWSVHEESTGDTSDSQLLYQDEGDLPSQTNDYDFTPEYSTRTTSFRPQDTGEYIIELEVDTPVFSEDSPGGEYVGHSEKIEVTGESDYDLLKQHAPILEFHPDEEFYPTRLEAIFDNAVLCGDETERSQSATLYDIGVTEEFLNNDDLYLAPYPVVDSYLPANLPCDTERNRYLNDEVFEPLQAYDPVSSQYPNSVYGVVRTDVSFDPSDIDSHVTNYQEAGHKDEIPDEGGTYTALGYWMVYVNDPKPEEVRGILDTDFFESLPESSTPYDTLAAHTGDIEPIWILLNDDDEPEWVLAQQHKGGEYRLWEHVETREDPVHDTEHPVIYPAEGAHSNFFGPKTQNQDQTVRDISKGIGEPQYVYQQQYLCPASCEKGGVPDVRGDTSISRFSPVDVPILPDGVPNMNYIDPIGWNTKQDKSSETWVSSSFSGSSEESYELAVLTEDEDGAWTDYEGAVYRYSNLIGDVDEKVPAFDGVIPQHSGPKGEENIKWSSPDEWAEVSLFPDVGALEGDSGFTELGSQTRGQIDGGFSGNPSYGDWKMFVDFPHQDFGVNLEGAAMPSGQWKVDSGIIPGIAISNMPDTVVESAELEEDIAINIVNDGMQPHEFNLNLRREDTAESADYSFYANSIYPANAVGAEIPLDEIGIEDTDELEEEVEISATLSAYPEPQLAGIPGTYQFDHHTFTVGPEDPLIDLPFRSIIGHTGPITTPLDNQLSTLSTEDEHPAKLTEIPVVMEEVEPADELTVEIEGEDAFEVEPFSPASHPETNQRMRFHLPEKDKPGSYNITVSTEIDEDTVSATSEDALVYVEPDEVDSIKQLYADTTSETYYAGGQAELTASFLGSEPISDAEVTAEVETPENETITTSLQETDDGIYTGLVELDEETLTGEYNATVTAEDPASDLNRTENVSWTVDFHAPVELTQMETPKVLPGETTITQMKLTLPGGARAVSMGVSNLKESDPLVSPDIVPSDGIEVDSSHMVTQEAPEFAEVSVDVPEGVSPGEYTGVVSGHVDSTDAPVKQELQVDVLQPALFDVGIDKDSTENSVVDGETLEVHVEVTNEGDVQGIQEVELLGIDNKTRDTRVLSLKADESERVVLEWNTEEDEVGIGEVTVKSEDRRDSMEVEVGEPAEFEVIDVDAPESVSPGEVAELQAEFENIGDVDGSQQVELLDFSGDVVDSTKLSLEAGEQQEVEFEWRTDEDIVGRDSVSVRSEDSEVSTELLVGEPPHYAVEVDEGKMDETVAAGELLEVYASVENEGDVEGSQQVELLDFDGEVVDSTTLSLEADEQQEVVFEWHPDDGDISKGDVVVRSEDEQVAAEVLVGEPPYFDVEILEGEFDAQVDSGDVLEVHASVENEGDVEDSQQVELLDFDGEVVDSTLVSLEADEQQEVVLEWGTDADDIGWGNVSVRSADEQILAEILVGESPHYAVDLLENESDDQVVDEGVLEVVASVENEGDVEGAQDVELFAFDGDLVDSTTLVLDAGEQQEILLEWRTDSDDIGWGNVSVRSEDEVDTAEVLVGEPPQYTVDVIENKTDEVVSDGETLEVYASVENEGDVEGVQQVELLDFGGDVVDYVNLSLESGEQQEIVMEWETNPGGIGRDNLSVHSDDSNDTIEVLVGEPPHFGVEVNENKTRDNVSDGEALEVYASVKNQGDVDGTDDIELLDFTGKVVDSTKVSLNTSETAEIVFDWSTTEDDVGIGNVTVRSEDTNSSMELLVGEPAFYDVNINDSRTQEEAAAGETLQVYASIENQGDAETSQDIELHDFNRETVNSTTLTLQPSEKQEINLQWETTEDDVGTGNITVSSDDTKQSTQATVEDATEFELTDVDATEPRLKGTTIDVEATVVNNGDTDGEQQIELKDQQGNTIDSIVVSLNAGETKPVTLQWTADEVGGHQLEVETEGDAQTALVRVVETEGGVVRTAIESIPIEGYRFSWWAEFHQNLLLHQVDTFETLKEDHENPWLAKLYLEHRIKPTVDRWAHDDYSVDAEDELTKQEVLETIEHVSDSLQEELWHSHTSSTNTVGSTGGLT